MNNKRRILQLITAVVALLVGTSNLWAQAVASAGIRGRVADESGAVLPGVTITATSPALQVPQRIQTTDAEGNYVFRNLPAGTYRLSYELAGFATVNREGLELPVAFQATVNVTLSLASVAETITVTGESPVVDVTSTAIATNFTAESLESVPRGSSFSDIVDMAPGVTRAAVDVGGSTMGNRPNMSTYGMQATPKIQVEGINITTGSDANTAVYTNFFGTEEVQIKTSGTSAEVGTPGLHLIGVIKSGGNEYHGDYQFGYSGSSLQSSNLNADLEAQGLSDTNPLKFHYEANGDLGGRIIRDKLWFYGGVSRQHRRSSPLGFVEGPGPDGEYLTGDEPLALWNTMMTTWTIKSSWQVSETNKLVGFYQYGDKRQPQDVSTSRFRPLEGQRDYHDPTWIYKAEWQSMIGDNALLNVVGGYGGYFADYSAMRAPWYTGPDVPSRYDRNTRVETGPRFGSDQRPRDNYQADASLNYYSPGGGEWGSHELKTGINYYRYTHGTGKLNQPHGNYRLTYDAGVPREITIANFPHEGRNRLNVLAGYVQDAWRLNDRITANLGVRFEHQDAFAPEQSYPGSPEFPSLFPAQSFAQVDVITWNSVLPRLGFAWDLGGGRSVLKASFGLYNDLFRDADVNLYNGNADRDAVFRWRDPNGSGNYEPGEVNLDLNGPDFISIEGASARAVNRDLKQPKTMEFTVSFERELAANMGVRLGFIHRERRNAYDFGGVNVLRPREVYNIALQRRDPGPDGVLDTTDDGGAVTIYDYDPAYRGADFVSIEQVNTDKVDRFSTIEGALTKKLSQGWTASIAAWALKNNRWLEWHFDTPNDDPFPKDETWDFGLNFNGFYQLPHDFQLAGFVQARSGVKGQRTYVFRRADPDGGPSLQQLSTVTLRLDEYGSWSESPIVMTNLRLSKFFSLGGTMRAGFDIDLFNLFNSSSPTDAGYVSGPTFGYVEDVLSPRIIRVRGRFSF